MTTTWFITGAGRGLGLHLAWAAADAGHRVVATGPDRARLGGVLGPDREDLMTLGFDLMDPADAQAAVTAAMSRFGAIDVLVHNASHARPAFAEDLEQTGLRAHFLADFFAAHQVTQAALPFMQAGGGGLIFHVAAAGAPGPAVTIAESGPIRTGLPAGMALSDPSPQKLARELVRLAGAPWPPLRCVADAPGAGPQHFLH